MRLAVMLALAMLTVASCYRDGYSPDGGDGGGLGAYTVSGVVTGTGKANTTLTLQGPGAPQTATSNVIGAYQFLNVTQGSYTLTATQKGFAYTPSSQVVTVAKAVTVPEFSSGAAQYTYAVSGTVSGGVPAGVLLTVKLSGANAGATLTSAEGAFRLEGLTPATYTLTPTLAGYTFTPASRTVVVTGETKTGQDFTAKAIPYGVSGTVTGDVKAGVELTLSNNSNVVLATITDAQGVYSIQNVTAGTYTLTPRISGYTFTPTSRSVTLTGADTSGQDFTAKAVQAATYTVSGTVTGDVKVGVTVTLSGPGKPLATTTDATGSFSIPNAPAGTYTLTPSLAGFVFFPASRSVAVSGAAVNGQDFTGVPLGWKARSPLGKTGNWYSVAMSSDGKIIAAASFGNPMYTSSDYGATWQVRNSGVFASNSSLCYLDMSKDGKFLAAAACNGHVYTSSDFGATWQDRTSGVIQGDRLWKTIAISDDGKYLAAAVFPGDLYTSNNNGETWVNRSSGVIPSPRNWQTISMSSNGSYIAAGVLNGHIYTSSDFGVTWQDRSLAPINGDIFWGSAAMTGDGRSLAAVDYGGSVYMSNDYGANWKNKSSGAIANSMLWQTIAMSSDGKFLAAAVYGGHVYASNNSGDFWEDKSSGAVAGDIKWQSVSISDDGRYIAVGGENTLVFTYASP